MEYYIENSALEGEHIFHCHKEEIDGGRTIVDAHIHDRIEVLFCTKGKMNIMIGGIEYSFTPGCIAVIPSNEIHRIQTITDEHHEYIVVKFPLEYISSNVPQEDFPGVLPFILKGSGTRLVFDEDNTVKAGLFEMAENMLAEADAQKYGFELTLRSGVLNIILYVMRAWNEELPSDYKLALGTERTKRIYDALFYIQNNFKRELDLRAISDLFGVSYSYFSRQFSAVTGKTFANYLCNVRLSEAEYRLVVSDATVTDIAYECGFTDASYFTRRFSAKNGMSPAAWRKKYGSQTGSEVITRKLAPGESKGKQK